MNMSSNPSQNAAKNLNDNFGYAHFSEIDRVDLERFPNLAFARPYRCVIQAGECLFIPKKWWHWVKTREKTVAVNYWIESTEILTDRPELQKLWNQHTQITDRISQLLQSFNQEVWVWNSLDNTSGLMRFQDFYRLHTDHLCVITLDGYSHELLDDGNEQLKVAIKKVLPTPPELLAIARSKIHLNAWITSGKHDTGLHYDDADGWLCVLEGSKDVELFCPEDSQFLYPCPVSPDWVYSTPDFVKYNTFQYFHPVDGWSSSRLLYETLKVYGNFKSVFQAIEKYRRLFGPNRLIWGFKNLNGDCRWELYYYHYSIQDRYQPDKSMAHLLSPQINSSSISSPSTIIHSIDLFNRETSEGKDLHIYQKSTRAPAQILELPFFGEEFTVYDGITGLHHPFIYDTQPSFLDKYSSHQQDLGFALDFKHLISMYRCQDICVFNKEDVLLVMFIGIHFDDFMYFLAQNNYKIQLIQHLQDHRSFYESLSHEVAIGYDTTSLLPLRSAIYGIL